MALFVALTRSVRESEVPVGIRQRAFDLLDRLAHTLGSPEFEGTVGELGALADGEPRLRAALQPFWPELRAPLPARVGRSEDCQAF